MGELSMANTSDAVQILYDAEEQLETILSLMAGQIYMAPVAVTNVSYRRSRAMRTEVYYKRVLNVQTASASPPFVSRG